MAPITGPNGISDVIGGAITAHSPAKIEIDIVNVLDVSPNGSNLAEADGFVWTGSPLSVTSSTPEIEGLKEWMILCAASKKPIFGICFGLQLAAVVAGGEVGRNPRGRESVISRKVEITSSGEQHPMMDRRQGSFDVMTDHVDAITRLPERAVCLASNTACEVQAASFDLNGAEVWGTQYHPDIDLPMQRLILLESRAERISEGYFEDTENFERYLGRLERLIAEPDARDARWQLGFDDDVLNPIMRYAELHCWLDHQIL